MISNILIYVDDINHIDDYRKAGVSAFLFPLEGFSVGYKTFSLEEIKLAVEYAHNLEKKVYKMTYKTENEAKSTWKNLYDTTNLNKLEATTKIALWLENYFESNNKMGL